MPQSIRHTPCAGQRRAAHGVCRIRLDGADSSKELAWGGMAVLEQGRKAEGGTPVWRDFAIPLSALRRPPLCRQVSRGTANRRGLPVSRGTHRLPVGEMPSSPAATTALAHTVRRRNVAATHQPRTHNQLTPTRPTPSQWTQSRDFQRRTSQTTTTISVTRIAAGATSKETI